MVKVGEALELKFRIDSISVALLLGVMVLQGGLVAILLPMLVRLEFLHMPEHCSVIHVCIVLISVRMLSSPRAAD